MAWTTPRTWVAGETVTAALFNTHIRDNLNALKSPPTDSQRLDEANLTTTAVAFADIDAAGDPDLSLSITTTGGDVLVGFYGNITNNVDQNTFFDITLDGTRQGLDDGLVAILSPGSTAPGRMVAFTYLIRSVSAAAHTINMQWKTSAGNTTTLYTGAGTANGDLHPQFWAREI